MFDLPVMLAVIICLLIAWERSRREEEYTPGKWPPEYCNRCPFANEYGVCMLNDDITCTYEPVTRAADCPLTNKDK